MFVCVGDLIRMNVNSVMDHLLTLKCIKDGWRISERITALQNLRIYSFSIIGTTSISDLNLG